MVPSVLLIVIIVYRQKKCMCLLTRGGTVLDPHTLEIQIVEVNSSVQHKTHPTPTQSRLT